MTQEIRESVIDPLEEAQKPLREAMEPLEELDKDIRGNIKSVEKDLKNIGKGEKKDAAKAAGTEPALESKPAPETEAAQSSPETDAPREETIITENNGGEST